MPCRYPKKAEINPTKIYLNVVVVVCPFARLPLNLNKKVLIHVEIYEDLNYIYLYLGWISNNKVSGYIDNNQIVEDLG